MNQPSCTLDVSTALKYNSQGRVLLLLVSKKILSPSLDTSNTLRIVENRLEMRNLWPPKVKGVKNLKKKKLLKPVLKHPENSFYVFFGY
jgi:hypothetical protein